jgi:hypothetical protein
MRRGFGLLWVAITAVVAGVASYFSYEAGLSQGLAAKLPAGASAPYLWYGPHWGFGWGLAFPFFGLFWFLLFLLFLFWIARGFGRFGRRGWGGGGHHHYEERMHEWHRQAHEGSGQPGEPSKQ